MMANGRNEFINDRSLSEATSLIHLLDQWDTDVEHEINVIKHSPYCAEQEFSNLISTKTGLSILSVNIQSIHSKFTEFELFIERTNRVNPISVICLQECWTNDNTYMPLYNLFNYKLIHQGQRCCPHGGLVIYVHEQFSIMDPEILQATTGWEYLCIQIFHNSPY